MTTTQTTQIIIGDNAPSKQNERANNDVTALILAAISSYSEQLYQDENAVKNALAEYLPEWEVAWQPVKPKEAGFVNYAFIAQSGDQYVIAIRGSLPIDTTINSILNWIVEDFDLFSQKFWRDADNKKTNAIISLGATIGLEFLTQLIDSNGKSMLDFLSQQKTVKYLCVTGHSLGGNLATVYSLWLQQKLAQLKQLPQLFSVITFAAPTAWDQNFANLFDKTFSTSWRYVNVMDIVPFSACHVDQLAALYGKKGSDNPYAPSAYDVKLISVLTLAEAFKMIYGELKKGKGIKAQYAQVNGKTGTCELNQEKTTFIPITPINPISPSSPDSTIHQTNSIKKITNLPLYYWGRQAGIQHDHNKYLHFLGYDKPVGAGD
ncbi:MAG: hypothetical protein QE487_18395 [Fluviicola sp.]|nr:hypothetical protein [Fluviicola sp.]